MSGHSVVCGCMHGCTCGITRIISVVMVVLAHAPDHY